MPELPEVETIVTDLRQYLLNKKISQVTILNQSSVWPKSLAKSVVGSTIRSIDRYGKNIVIKLGLTYLVIHLKMTGQLVWRAPGLTLAGGHPIINVGDQLPNKFTRVILKISRGYLYFNDVRKFGWMRLMTQGELNDHLLKLGIEPLTDQFSGPYLKKLISARTTAIKKVLLDQSLIAGLGNIYVDEALWLAGILPDRSAKGLESQEINRLARAIKTVLKLSINNRGTSFSDYRDATGAKGANLEFLKVYNKQHQPCPRCGAIIQKKKLGGRGTHWCSHCQQ